MKTQAPGHEVARSGWACAAHAARLALAVGMLAACQSVLAGTCNNPGPPYEIPAQTSTVFLDTDCAGVGGEVTVVGDIDTNGQGIFDGTGNQEGWLIDIPDGVSVVNDASMQTIHFRSPNGEVKNRGVIKNAGGGEAVLFNDLSGASGPGTIVNDSTGEISSVGFAISLQAGGQVTNEAGGVIQSVTFSAVSSSGGFIEVENGGTIETLGNSFQNAITGNSGGDINNSGTIIGRLNFFGSGSLNVTNTGSIEGLPDQPAIRLNAISAIIVNSGEIRAGAGAANAISFGNQSNSLQLRPGYSIEGRVIGNSSVDSLVFGGAGSDSFSLDDVGGGLQYQNFEFLGLESGNWTFDGVMDENFSLSGGVMDLGAGSVEVGNFVQSGGTVENGTLSADIYLISDGTVDATFGNSNLVSVGAGTVQFGPNTTLDSAGTLDIDADATLNLGGTSQTTAALFLTDGELENGTLGAGSFVVNNGWIRADLTGAGALTKNAPGIVYLSGDNDYAGGTTVDEGTLRGNTESLPGDIVNEASLVFNQSVAGTYSGELSGSGGTLTKGGPGTLTMAADSSAFTGDTQIASGRLQVNGQLGGDVIIFDGSLGGSGGISGNVSVSPSAGPVSLAPGGGPGTLSVGGDLRLSPDLELVFELDQPGGGNDRVVVGGDLTLDGTLQVVDLGGYGAGTYTLIDYAGTLTDDTLEIASAPAGFNVAIDTSTAGDVVLVVEAVVDEMFSDRFEP